ncbi:uroporphyrinogen-III synthase [Glaciecola sp. KUL10]|uniref:uroporphyrinogen-III synthase n=1 Tax=Glaciecola sp. (strain KUL10) TaxID=2161813 RepID=UPI000D782CBB|nr:uroporphyrinogen-III synthase [Glaciecola sp. KUL10]GBL03558.1 uroporphyrinogen-III synthase [Glaciecola sp. KUL10]
MILVLRPEGKAQETADLLANNGYSSIPVAALSIRPNQQQRRALHIALDFNNYRNKLSTFPDGLVVTSTYAASALIEILEQMPAKSNEFKERVSSLPVFCVGKSCQAMLVGQFQNIYSGNTQDSESLLRHPLLQRPLLVNKRLLLLKGEQGRDLLPNELASRGAQLSTFDLYKRVSNTSLIATIDCVKLQIDCIIATSQELCELLLNNQPHEQLQAIKWVVVSERIKQYLVSKGINDIYLSSGAQSQALLACVKQLKET